MIINIFSKSKGVIIYKNVKNIKTSVNYVDDKPIFQLRIIQVNNSKYIDINDVTGFSIYNSDMTWIDDCTDIICPHCGQEFDYDIMNMAHGDRIMQYCPKCGKKVDVDSYFNPTIRGD